MLYDNKLSFPLLTENLAAQFEKCDTYYIGGRLQALAKLDGNPYGAAVRQFEGATGMLVRSMPFNPVFNRVADFGVAQNDRLDEIIEWYTSFASASQHNMEKMGMRLAYTEATWTPLRQV